MHILPLLIAFLLTNVYAWPGNPGTCDVHKMSREGHGPSLSNCEDCYGIAASGGVDHLSYSLKVTGRDEFQGFLLYVQDETNSTVGTFRSYDANLFLPVECQDAAEWDLENTIGHSNPTLKQWPLEFGWAAAVTEEEATRVQPGDKMTVRGMVVIDYDHWHILPEFSFSIAHPDAKETAPQRPDTDRTQIHHHEHPNKLFYIVLFIAFIVYNGMSILHRTLQKRRRQTRQSQPKLKGADDSTILLQDW